MLFEQFDAVTDCAMGDAQLIGGPGKTLQACHGFKGGKRMQRG